MTAKFGEIGMHSMTRGKFWPESADNIRDVYVDDAKIWDGLKIRFDTGFVLRVRRSNGQVAWSTLTGGKDVWWASDTDLRHDVVNMRKYLGIDLPMVKAPNEIPPPSTEEVDLPEVDPTVTADGIPF